MLGVGRTQWIPLVGTKVGNMFENNFPWFKSFLCQPYSKDTRQEFRLQSQLVSTLPHTGSLAGGRVLPQMKTWKIVYLSIFCTKRSTFPGMELSLIGRWWMVLVEPEDNSARLLHSAPRHRTTTKRPSIGQN